MLKTIYLLVLFTFLKLPVFGQQDFKEKKESYKLYSYVFNSYNVRKDIKLKSMTIIGTMLSEFADTAALTYEKKLEDEKLVANPEWQFLKNERNYRNKGHILQKVGKGKLKEYLLKEQMQKDCLKWDFLVSPIIFSEDMKSAFVIAETAANGHILSSDLFFFEFEGNIWQLVKKQTLGLI